MASVRRMALAAGVTAVCSAGITQWSLVSGGEQFAAGDGKSVINAEQGRRKTLSMKLKLLDRLVNHSASANRIRNSGDVEAKQLLEKAEQDRVHALESAQSDALEQSEHFVDSGLAAVSNATRKVRDRGREQAVHRRHYEELRKRVLSFSEAFRRIVNDKPGQAVADLLDQDEIGRRLLDAQRLAESGDYVSANQSLRRAADDVERALSRARDKETLVHELSFDSPEGEYQHEKQRNEGYIKLITMFGGGQALEGTAAQYVQDRLEENRKLCAEAQALFEQGEIESAVRRLELGTELLARTLRASGVAF